ncbi:MAG: response regulator [Acidobacteria bacterium]|nr:response regulator [Acidobacteriota bacterium]
MDDNRLGLIARKTVLEELGYRITTAASGSEALDEFSGASFDLLITDYRMPRMNGKELIERVRKQSPTLPVILLSGFVDSLGLDEKSTGADVVIQKSANEVAHLVRSVKRLACRKPLKKPAGSETPAASARLRKKPAGS